jgi:hypothetical protein
VDLADLERSGGLAPKWVVGAAWGRLGSGRGEGRVAAKGQRRQGGERGWPKWVPDPVSGLAPKRVGGLYKYIYSCSSTLFS